jgi:hypothetical protein
MGGFSLDSTFISAGKTYFLYYVLIDRLLRGSPTLFQMSGTLYIFDERSVRVQSKSSALDLGKFVAGTVWALVNGDPKEAKLHPCIVPPVLPGLLILLASSPKNKEDRGWLTQKSGFAYIMDNWDWTELVITRYFIHILSD